MSIKLIFASTAALALAAGTPAFAARSSQSEQGAAAADTSASQAKSQRKTCRMIEKTESRVGRLRLCLTEPQWKKFDEEQDD
jgi:S-adenosylhomocysteine hydrolase